MRNQWKMFEKITKYLNFEPFQGLNDLETGPLRPKFNTPLKLPVQYKTCMKPSLNFVVFKTGGLSQQGKQTWFCKDRARQMMKFVCFLWDFPSLIIQVSLYLQLASKPRLMWHHWNIFKWLKTGIWGPHTSKSSCNEFMYEVSWESCRKLSRK